MIQISMFGITRKTYSASALPISLGVHAEDETTEIHRFTEIGSHTLNRATSWSPFQLQPQLTSHTIPCSSLITPTAPQIYRNSYKLR